MAYAIGATWHDDTFGDGFAADFGELTLHVFERSEGSRHPYKWSWSVLRDGEQVKHGGSPTVRAAKVDCLTAAKCVPVSAWADM